MSRLGDPNDLLDRLATEIALTWESSKTTAPARQAFLSSAFRRSPDLLFKAIGESIDAEIKFLDNADQEGLHNAAIQSLFAPPHTSPNGDPTMPTTPPRGHIPTRRTPRGCLPMLALVGFVLTGIYLIAHAASAPTLRLRYSSTNAEGCRLFEGLDGPARGRVFAFCARSAKDI